MKFLFLFKYKITNFKFDLKKYSYKIFKLTICKILFLFYIYLNNIIKKFNIKTDYILY